MFGNKLPYVMSDCDGTISNHDLSIDKVTIKSIKRYQKKSGYRFSFCTGRLDAANKKIAKQLNVQLPIVSCNGALITDLNTNEVLFADYLDPKPVSEIFKEAHKLGIDIIAYEPGAMVGTKNSARLQVWSEYMKTIEKKYTWPLHYYDNLNELAIAIEQGLVKPVELTMLVPDEVSKKAGFSMLNKYRNIFDIAQSLPTMFNVMNKGTNKLSGLKQWAEIVKTDYKDVITFGDNYNDIEMISGVSKGIAVGNAVDALKAVAFEISDDIHNNGVGKFLESLVD